MTEAQPIHCDLLVIGRSLAGMTAAARAASYGLKTVQTGGGAGFYMASGLVDFLGVYPPEKGQVLADPEDGLEALANALPGHPYARTSTPAVYKSLSFLRQTLGRAGLDYHYEEGRNHLVLTAAGTFKPSFMIPASFANGTADKLKNRSVLFVDFKGLKGYSARQIAQTLKPLCPGASCLRIAIPGQWADLPPIHLAGLLSDSGVRDQVCTALAKKAKGMDLVGLPAVCGIHDHEAILADLETAAGCPCFEIPGLPPSIPGLRLKNALEEVISRNHVRVFNNTEVRMAGFEKADFIMQARNQNRENLIRAKGVILATGRFQGNGLAADRDAIFETVFGLEVSQPSRRNRWYDIDFFNPRGHDVNRAGVETSPDFQPLGKDGSPLYEHLYAAGTILAHNDWARLKSGGAVSCLSAVSAVDRFYRHMKAGS